MDDGGGILAFVVMALLMFTEVADAIGRRARRIAKAKGRRKGK